MKYSFNSRIRYSETGENACLTLPGILNYFQDCSTFHSEAIGQGMKVIKQSMGAVVLAGSRESLSEAWRKYKNHYFSI